MGQPPIAFSFSHRYGTRIQGGHTVAQRRRQAKAQRRRQAKRVGITHFPVNQEQRTQEAVPPRGETKRKGRKQIPAPRKRAKSVAETMSEQDGLSAESRVTSRGSKGGRSSGSRAGLLSRRETEQARKARRPHPLDLL